jgi:hypothetical protein
MKCSPSQQKITETMAPGVFSQGGFLGTDDRPLSEVVDSDRSTLAQLGVSPRAIADGLLAILELAVAASGAPVAAVGGQTATLREAMGRIPSPYGDGVFPKGEVEVTRPDGTTWRFTPLSIHLIREHGFFQGKGSRYRLEPAQAMRDLDLTEKGDEQG